MEHSTPVGRFADVHAQSANFEFPSSFDLRRHYDAKVETWLVNVSGT